MSYSYQFRLEIIKIVTEQDFDIRQVAELHQIPYSLVINWINAFCERRLVGVKSPCTTPCPPQKGLKPTMKRKD